MAETIITKRCPHCKQIKPLSEFSKNRNRKDRVQYNCKSCAKQYAQSEKGKTANKKGVEKYRRTERGRVARRKASRKCQKTPKGKATRKRYSTRNPEHCKARSATNQAITNGILPRPDSLLCHYCPKQAQQYHHWHGYEKEHWFDIVPVCRICHIQQHCNTN